MQINSKQHKNYDSINTLSNVKSNVNSNVKSNDEQDYCLLVSRVLFLSVVFFISLLWIYYLTKIALKNIH